MAPDARSLELIGALLTLSMIGTDKAADALITYGFVVTAGNILLQSPQ